MSDDIITDQRDPAFPIPESIAFTLRRPIKGKSGEISSLTFRIPTFADLKATALADESLAERRAAAAQRTRVRPPLVEDGRAGQLLARLNIEGLTEEALGGMTALDVQLALEQIEPYLRLSEKEEPDLPQKQRAADFEIPEQITHRLLRPIPRAGGTGETISAVSFRPPSYDEAKKISARHDRDGATVGSEFMMMLLSEDGLTAVDLGRLLALDFQLSAEKLAPFLALSS